MPAVVAETPLTTESLTGATLLDEGSPWTEAVLAFLSAAGKTPADLQNAQAYDPNRGSTTASASSDSPMSSGRDPGGAGHGLEDGLSRPPDVDRGHRRGRGDEGRASVRIRSTATGSSATTCSSRSSPRTRRSSRRSRRGSPIVVGAALDRPRSDDRVAGGLRLAELSRESGRVTGTYTHGHHESVLRSHRWRTAENSAAYLVPYLEAGGSVLDVGCGPGTITIDLARRVAPGQVVGIDAVIEPLEMARSDAVAAHVDNVTFQVADAYALPFDEASFDVVHAHQVLQHLTDPGRRAARDGSRVPT